MGGLPSTPLSPLPLAPQGARLYIRRIKEECVTPLYYSGVIALRADFDRALDLDFALCPVSWCAPSTVRARVGQGSAGEQLARFAVVDWGKCCGEVLRRSVLFQSGDGRI